ncbi:MAG TPA: DUF929 family protein [Candidatus Saccharimonadales bacterium]|nr:DUF929 family protein [Candidatus Saccharimonadales bacterium]
MRTIRPFTLALASAVLLVACDGGGAANPGGASVPASAPPAAVAGAGGMQSVTKVLQSAQLSGNLPLTLYVGADYCPFCASMRWPLVKALSRFGTFSGLGQRQSTAGVDGFPSLATYDFNRATYRSQYVAFQAVETADADGNPLQQPDATQASLINQFDPSGGIPFIFVAGRYAAQLPYSPSLLEGRTFEQIRDDIDGANPDPLGQAIDQEADVITALICSSDSMQPATACSTSQVQRLVTAIPS